jgi:uncharacterized Zn finger protein
MPCRIDLTNIMRWGWSFKPYLSAAEKRRRASKSAMGLEGEGQKLNPIRVEGSAISRSFWGKAWCENLESYSDFKNRLPRGRTYLRNGSVVDFQIIPGEIRALVSGSELYRIAIKIEPVPKAEWKALKSDCAGQVGSLMDLLQGKLSAQVMEIITRRKTGLFPRPTEIGLSCSCPDWAGMCKHVAATLYAVGARLDENPELLFVLRGADHLELVTEATESVISGVSTLPEASGPLTGDNLEEIFGIEIEPASALTVHTAEARLPRPRTPKQSSLGSRSKDCKAEGARKAKISSVNKALAKRSKRANTPTHPEIT